MSQYILFFFLGLSLGAVYAALTMGIVVTYQGTGVINFAAAAMATIPLYVFSFLEEGELRLPVPWLPSIDVGPPPTWVSVVIALVGRRGVGCPGARGDLQAAAHRSGAGQGGGGGGHHAHPAGRHQLEVRHRPAGAST